MRIFISAGEASSDLHAAEVVKELRKLTPEAVFFGIGGDHLKDQGVELILHNRELSVGGGPRELFSKIPLRRKIEKRIENDVFSGNKIDGAILVDSGEINLRIAGLLNFFKIPVVYYIPPKVWVWRHRRIEKIYQHIKKVFSILPFESPIYQGWEIPFEYVGNPLVDEVPINVSKADSRNKLGIDNSRKVLVVMPGSRHNEIRDHVEVFSKGITKFYTDSETSEKLLIVVPVAQAIDPSFLETEFRKYLDSRFEVKFFKGLNLDCLAAADFGLIKSGTSTLEAALCNVPMVLAYKVSKSSQLIYRHIVRYRGFVGLVNLFFARDIENALGWGTEKPKDELVEELILEKCTPNEIARALREISQDTKRRVRQLEEFKNARKILNHPTGASPSKTVAIGSLEIFKKFANGVQK